LDLSYIPPPEGVREIAATVIANAVNDIEYTTISDIMSGDDYLNTLSREDFGTFQAAVDAEIENAVVTIELSGGNLY
jgi:hypothetical protein